jgi:formate C-acetyltransferase
MTERVEKMRAAYRDTTPEICIARYKILTEFYMNNPALTGILRRAKVMKEIFEKLPVRIGENEVIVGNQSAKYRAGALYPENCVSFIKDEVASGTIRTREIDPYMISDEDMKYVADTIDYWLNGESTYAKTNAYYPEQYEPHDFNGVTTIGRMVISDTPVGHFSTGYNKAIRVGFKAIKEEAVRKQQEIIDSFMQGDDIEKYNFYRAVEIVCDGMITFAKRHSKLAAEMAAVEKNPTRKAELEKMAEVLDWIFENPCRNFHEALQCLYLYQTCLCLEANMHGITFGRVDQYLGDFAERDIANGVLTEDQAQELMDMFYLKVAEMNKPWSFGATQSAPGYTSGQMMSMGGVDAQGNDASNKVTYMMLQSVSRLVLHDPPQSLRIHKGTPPELWEAAIETTKICGGLPTFENDDVIIPSLMENRGFTLEDARNYTPIGCVEPGGCGNDWPACGGTGSCSYFNLPNVVWHAINDGHLAAPLRFGAPKEGEEASDEINDARVGLATGYLYEMESFDQVMKAFIDQMNFFLKWHIIVMNNAEYTTRELLPLPVVSCTMGGCMESGKDVMFGGAKYNSSGLPGIGLSNTVDSLFMIKHLCFDTKKCTTRELYDALKANWVGHEELQRYIKNDCPHYGNGLEEVDSIARIITDEYAKTVNSITNPRGQKWSAAMFPVTANVMFGMMTAATPDGRSAGVPLADGISPVQQMDKNGPTAIAVSCASWDQKKYPGGTLMNMKFSPSCIQGEMGVVKLSQLIQTYFEMGGMEMQINVISVDTLRDAQKNPDNYKNLVVRVAGFSAYFVELHVTGQDDLISRTELSM